MYVHVRIHICCDKPELFLVDVGVVTYVKHKTLSERHATLGIRIRLVIGCQPIL